MPRFQNELLEQQKKLLGAQIEELEALLEMDPDNSDYLTQLDALEEEMNVLQDQRHAYRQQQHELWKSGKGKKPKDKS